MSNSVGALSSSSPRGVTTHSHVELPFLCRGPNVVSSYEHHYNTIASATADEAITDLAGKECSNLIVLLSELYNFQAISCVLIYDMIRTLLSTELSEFVVELLLKLLRSRYRCLDPSLWLTGFETQGNSFDRMIRALLKISSRLSRVRHQVAVGERLKSTVSFYLHNMLVPSKTPL